MADPGEHNVNLSNCTVFHDDFVSGTKGVRSGALHQESSGLTLASIFECDCLPREALEAEDERLILLCWSQVGRKMTHAEIYSIGRLPHGKELEEGGLFGAAGPDHTWENACHGCRPIFVDMRSILFRGPMPGEPGEVCDCALAPARLLILRR